MGIFNGLGLIIDVLDAPSFEEVYDVETIVYDLIHASTTEYTKDFLIDIKDGGGIEEAIENYLEEPPEIKEHIRKMLHLLIEYHYNSRIKGDIRRFKINFTLLLQQELPRYQAYFNDYNLDSLKSDEAFNKDGSSSYSDTQNTDNKINDWNNYEKGTLNTFTPEERERQFVYKTTKINEFLNSFNDLFNGVK